MTAGTDGKTIDGMGMARINALIEKMRDFSYQPNPARRTYIPKSNGKMRPLGIPSFDDKLIQEVVRLSNTFSGLLIMPHAPFLFMNWLTDVYKRQGIFEDNTCRAKGMT